MDNKKILDKVEGRRHAEELFGIIEIDEESVEFREAFWLKFISLIPIPPDVEVPKLKRPTMTEEEALRFERKPILFGTHKDLLHQEVPTGYLLWLSKESEELASYLRSDIGQKRQEEEVRQREASSDPNQQEGEAILQEAHVSTCSWKEP